MSNLIEILVDPFNADQIEIIFASDMQRDVAISQPKVAGNQPLFPFVENRNLTTKSLDFVHLPIGLREREGLGAAVTNNLAGSGGYQSNFG